MNTGSQKAIVLVHGGFVDGSGWEGVYQRLKKHGYEVSVVQNPTETLAGDVAATRAVIERQDKPVILTAVWWSRKPGTIRRSSAWCTLPRLRPMLVNRSLP
jgi:hypothetical protein